MPPLNAKRRKLQLVERVVAVSSISLVSHLGACDTDQASAPRSEVNDQQPDTSNTQDSPGQANHPSGPSQEVATLPVPAAPAIETDNEENCDDVIQPAIEVAWSAVTAGEDSVVDPSSIAFELHNVAEHSLLVALSVRFDTGGTESDTLTIPGTTLASLGTDEIVFDLAAAFDSPLSDFSHSGRLQVTAEGVDQVDGTVHTTKSEPIFFHPDSTGLLVIYDETRLHDVYHSGKLGADSLDEEDGTVTDRVVYGGAGLVVPPPPVVEVEPVQ